MQDVVEEFRIFLAVDEDASKSTVYDYTRRLRTMIKEGFQIKEYLSDVATARETARRWLAGRRVETGYGGYNKDVRVLNALARQQAWELKFKPMRDPGPLYKGLTPEQVQRLFLYRARNRETTLRTLAAIQYALTVDLRGGEVWEARDEHMDPIRSLVYLESPRKRGPPRPIVVRRELWDPFKPFELWRKWRPRVPSDPTAIWTTSRGPGGVPRVLHRNSMTRMLRTAGKAAGVQLNFYVTRHTGLTQKHRHGADKDDLQIHAGHRDRRSIERYVRPDWDRYELAFRALKLPDIVPKTRRP